MPPAEQKPGDKCAAAGRERHREATDPQREQPDQDAGQKIIRNSVILVDQIERNRAAGADPWAAVVDAAMHRLRPILLTAAAAILGMIPIMRDVFWGPMAYAIVGGLAGATVLTLLFLPALYVAWFRIKETGDAGPRRSSESAQTRTMEAQAQSGRAF